MMTADEENAIVNASTEALMKQLSAGGKPVAAVVTVVFYKGGEDQNHIATRLDLDRPPDDEEDASRIEGGVLLAASDLLDTYVHERGLCADCNSKKGTVQ